MAIEDKRLFIDLVNESGEQVSYDITDWDAEDYRNMFFVDKAYVAAYIDWVNMNKPSGLMDINAILRPEDSVRLTLNNGNKSYQQKPRIGFTPNDENQVQTRIIFPFMPMMPILPVGEQGDLTDFFNFLKSRLGDDIDPEFKKFIEDLLDGKNPPEKE